MTSFEALPVSNNFSKNRFPLGSSSGIRVVTFSAIVDPPTPPKARPISSTYYVQSFTARSSFIRVCLFSWLV